jgi:hypothetical protein
MLQGKECVVCIYQVHLHATAFLVVFSRTPFVPPPPPHLFVVVVLLTCLSFLSARPARGSIMLQQLVYCPASCSDTGPAQQLQRHAMQCKLHHATTVMLHVVGI